MIATLILLLAGTIGSEFNGAAHRANVVATPMAAGIAGMPLKDGVIKRGAPLTGAPVVTLAAILANPQSFANRTVTVEGKIKQCCTRKGCWMELTAPKAANTVRVTFKDYGFFVPTNSKGMRVRAEGKVTVTTLSAEDVAHLNGEGAHIKPSADGTALEVGFVADGVELRK